jgi:hypothetical protein
VNQSAPLDRMAGCRDEYIDLILKDSVLLRLLAT